MTIYTVRKLSERLNVPLDTQIVVSEDDATVTGTSAMLVPGDSLTIEELLYGLMLPSGNDAAHCLASYFGGLLLANKKKEA
jgi:serine-type D-Ala-D-Ala carboxypeptidase (penicillin-binding protein 5/6)